MEPASRIRHLLRRLTATADTGLTFAVSPYDRARFQEVADVAAELSRLPEELLGAPGFVFEGGYATPKLIVRVAVVADDDRLLMVKEAEEVARLLSRPELGFEATKSDAFRVAIQRGFAAIKAEAKGTRKKR